MLYQAFVLRDWHADVCYDIWELIQSYYYYYINVLYIDLHSIFFTKIISIIDILFILQDITGYYMYIIYIYILYHYTSLYSIHMTLSGWC
jgi:hypothetical protein